MYSLLVLLCYVKRLIHKACEHVCDAVRSIFGIFKACILVAAITYFIATLSIMEGIRMTMLTMAYMSAVWTGLDVSETCGLTRHILTLRRR